MAELRFGADRKRSKRLHGLIDAFISPLQVAPFDVAAAAAYGRLGHLLTERGQTIGDFDVLIAAHALAWKRILVTNNLGHFSRVPGLAVESWVEDRP